MKKTNKDHGSMRDQLKTIKSKVGDLPRMANAWKEDGEDHINISNAATTELGRLLNPNTRMDVSHPVIGQFRSFSNLWHFVRSKTPIDELRTVQPWKAHTLMQKLAGGACMDTDANHDFIFAEAAWGAVHRNEKLAKKLAESELPFDIYQINESGLRTRILRLVNIVKIWEEVRKALQSGTEPNFAWLHVGKSEPLANIRRRLHLPSLEELEQRRRESVRPRPVVRDIDDVGVREVSMVTPVTPEEVRNDQLNYRPAEESGETLAEDQVPDLANVYQTAKEKACGDCETCDCVDTGAAGVKVEILEREYTPEELAAVDKVILSSDRSFSEADVTQDSLPAVEIDAEDGTSPVVL